MGQIPGEGQGILWAAPTPRTSSEESLTEMSSQHLEKVPSRWFSLSEGAALSRAMAFEQSQAGESW